MHIYKRSNLTWLSGQRLHHTGALTVLLWHALIRTCINQNITHTHTHTCNQHRHQVITQLLAADLLPCALAAAAVCYVMLCHVVSCYIMLCHVISCCVMFFAGGVAVAQHVVKAAHLKPTKSAGYWGHPPTGTPR
jgi:hypothetical protein